MFTLSCLSWGGFCTNGKWNKKRKSSDLIEGEGLRKHLSHQEPWESTAVLRHFSGGVGRSLSAELWAEKVIRQNLMCQFWEECVQEV